MCNAKLHLYSTVCCDALLAFTESKSTFQLLLCNQSNDLQCQPCRVVILYTEKGAHTPDKTDRNKLGLTDQVQGQTDGMD
jgi:hypothetical protein